jgi:hypothetical protein
MAAAAGGVGFAGFWIGSLMKIEAVPWPAALTWHGLVILLLAIGAIGIHRSAQSSRMQIWLGWLGAALVPAGQAFSLELAMVGSLIFGAKVVMAPSLPRWGGGLLALGAIAFLVTAAINGPFWGEPNPSPPLVPGLMFAASLIAIALGWIVLGLLRRKPPQASR